MSDWDKYTAAQLRQFKAGLDMEKLTDEEKRNLPLLDQKIQEKTIEETLARKEQETSFRTLSKKFDSKAEKLYPELKDEAGELHKKAQEYLEQMGTGTSDPQSWFGAVSLAADDLGIEPAGTRPTPDPTKTGKEGGKPPVEGDADKEGDAFLKRTAKLRGMLAEQGLIDMDPEKGAKERLTTEYAATKEDF